MNLMEMQFMKIDKILNYFMAHTIYIIIIIVRNSSKFNKWFIVYTCEFYIKIFLIQIDLLNKYLKFYK